MNKKSIKIIEIIPRNSKKYKANKINEIELICVDNRYIKDTNEVYKDKYLCIEA